MPPTRQDLRLVFAGTPDFAAIHLAALIEANCQLAGVYTQPDRPAGRGKRLRPTPVKALARRHDLPVHQPHHFRDSESRARLAALEADLMVVVAYGLILPESVLTIPKLGCINVHASLLPRWRGAAPIQRAIQAGDTETGITIMQMDTGLDTGDVLARDSCTIGADETGGSLHDKLAGLGPPALIRTLDALAAGRASPEPQDDTLSTYAPKIEKAEARVDWSADARAIERNIRAFNPFPVAFTGLDGQTIRLWAARVDGGDDDSPPGTIVDSDGNAIRVACGTGILAITEMQLPGKKRLPVADILRGQARRFVPGTRFSP
jgi:methionyl-tRNA formyltransferase